MRLTVRIDTMSGHAVIEPAPRQIAIGEMRLDDVEIERLRLGRLHDSMTAIAHASPRKRTRPIRNEGGAYAARDGVS